MKRSIGFGGALLLLAGSLTGALAQQTETTTVTTTTTEISQSGQIRIVPLGPVVLGPQVQIASKPADAVQPAPFDPAPRGTVIDTTAGSRMVQSVNGFDVIMDINGKWDASRALLTDGYNGAKFYPVSAIDSFWPLEVGKSTTFNIQGEGGVGVVRARVLRTETVTVPAGSFFTYVIERRDRLLEGGAENVATYWYAPAVGTTVKFEERMGRVGRARPSYEMVAIVLPHPLKDAALTPIAVPGDSPENRTAFCNERGSRVQLSDGRVLLLPCLTFIQTEIIAYRDWLSTRSAATTR